MEKELFSLHLFLKDKAKVGPCELAVQFSGRLVKCPMCCHTLLMIHTGFFLVSFIYLKKDGPIPSPRPVLEVSRFMATVIRHQA